MFENKKVPTVHIGARAGDFAKTVLMPGDPLRARFIAQHFLTDSKLVNQIRGMEGYTGFYGQKRVSVMGSGMGIPSIGIYSYELFHFYEVEAILRIGTIGGIAPGLKIGDVVLGQAACTDSSYPNQYALPGTLAPIASFDLLQKATEQAKEMGLTVRVGNLLSSDAFYKPNQNFAAWAKMGVLGVEMESTALYCNAMEAGKKALTICTVSDLPLLGEEASAEDRQTAFTDMMRLALETALD